MLRLILAPSWRYPCGDLSVAILYYGRSMTGAKASKSANFGFLERLDPSFVTLGVQAEQLFTINPAMCLVRLRLFGEKLARELAANAGVVYPEDSQLDLLKKLQSGGLLAPEIAKHFHSLRKTGNQAAHEGRGSTGVALHQMKMVRRMGLAVMQTLSMAQSSTKLPPFVPACSSSSTVQRWASRPREGVSFSVYGAAGSRSCGESVPEVNGELQSGLAP